MSKVLNKFRPGWWIFCIGRNEETNELILVATDLKKYDHNKDANASKFETLKPLSWYNHIHYAVIGTRFARNPDHLKEMILTYELQWNTTNAQHDPVAIRQMIDKLRNPELDVPETGSDNQRK